MKRNKFALSLLAILSFFFIIHIASAEEFSITIADDINYYIERDDNLRIGYDWEDDTTYNEIRSARISMADDMTTIILPMEEDYYVWLNRLNDDTKPFDVDIATPNANLSLSEVYSAYRYASFFYDPDMVDDDGSTFELFNLVSYPDTIPQIIIEPAAYNGECKIIIAPTFTAEKNYKQLVELPVLLDFIHAYEYGEVDLWITAYDEKDSVKFKNAQFNVDMMILCADDNMAYMAATKAPLVMKENGFFQLYYQDFLDGYVDYFFADLDGDEYFEIEQPDELFDYQEGNLSDML